MAFISQIKAGDFNIRVELMDLSATQDEFGGVTNTYTTVHTMWANKNVKSLRDVEEKFEGNELQSYSRFVYTIRYSSETKNIKSNWVLMTVHYSLFWNVRFQRMNSKIIPVTQKLIFHVKKKPKFLHDESTWIFHVDFTSNFSLR